MVLWQLPISKHSLSSGLTPEEEQVKIGSCNSAVVSPHSWINAAMVTVWPLLFAPSFIIKAIPLIVSVETKEKVLYAKVCNDLKSGKRFFVAQHGGAGYLPILGPILSPLITLPSQESNMF